MIFLQLEDCEAKILICAPSTDELANSARKMVKRPQDVQMFCLGNSEYCDNLLTLIGSIDPMECPDPVEVDVNDNIPVIFWSSGTTGKTK